MGARTWAVAARSSSRPRPRPGRGDTRAARGGVAGRIVVAVPYEPIDPPAAFAGR